MPPSPVAGASASFEGGGVGVPVVGEPVLGVAVFDVTGVTVADGVTALPPGEGTDPPVAGVTGRWLLVPPLAGTVAPVAGLVVLPFGCVRVFSSQARASERE